MKGQERHSREEGSNGVEKREDDWEGEPPGDGGVRTRHGDRERGRERRGEGEGREVGV